MINKVSMISFSAVNSAQKRGEKPKNTFSKKSANPYMDSFIKNAKETAPILLALTGLWSLLDFGSGKVSMAKSLKNNLAYFFTPILVFSSAVVAIIENKKPSKSSKQ